MHMIDDAAAGDQAIRARPTGGAPMPTSIGLRRNLRRGDPALRVVAAAVLAPLLHLHSLPASRWARALPQEIVR